MRFQIEIGIEHSGAVGASKSFNSSMHFHMFIQIRSLSEAESTVGEGAAVGSFICVDPQVVEEVVPLPEMFATVVMVAFQDFDISLRFGILEGKDSEFLGCGHMLFYLDRPQVECVTCLD